MLSAPSASSLLPVPVVSPPGPPRRSPAGVGVGRPGQDLRGVREALLAFAAYPTDGTETLYVNPGGVIRHQRRRRVVGVVVPPPLTLSSADQVYLEQVLAAVRRELDRLAAASQAATAPTSWTAQIVIPFRAGLPTGTLDVDEPGSEIGGRHGR